MKIKRNPAKYLLLSLLLLTLSACGAQEEPETVMTAEVSAAPVETQTLTAVTLLQPVNAYDAPDGDAMALETGTTLFYSGTENGWMHCLDESGMNVYLRLDPDDAFRVETPDGYLHVWTVLDGLSFVE
ncbi:MAG: hypothetical protein LUG15_00975 [Oscillospiraceae bacterium]|nr:hypothetical protein [Oscillospiraceae bacterium]MCC8156514.1 hypothetical protein [Oscillospiraceae bacterium]MCD7743649.1 hypothetical protein [Oscillospiraceae bacterium]MCD7852546.1 hypothetical protein [Oscillospiraceae bacterium]MCD8129375.1 hypothetical protein [Oscillospiraceae bacterium]